MNKRTKLITLIFFFPIFVFSQHFEVGVTAGISTYQGDLNPSNSRFTLGTINPMAGIFGRYNFNDFVTLRLGGTYGILAGDDAKAKKDLQQQRNLSFRSNLIEGSIVGEFNILGYQPYNLARPFSPYLFAGVAFFNFNPKAEYQDEWIALQPLGTEGQNLADSEKAPYKKTKFSIPFGIGVKYALSDTWNIGVELGIRKTFTDYIDDVSGRYADETLLLASNPLSAALANRSSTPQEPGNLRGNSEQPDWYTLLGVTISRNFLDNGLVGSRKRGRRSKTGCPTF